MYFICECRKCFSYEAGKKYITCPHCQRKHIMERWNEDGSKKAGMSVKLQKKRYNFGVVKI